MKSLHHVIVLLFVAVVSFSGTGKAVHAVQSDAEQAPASQDSPETTPPTDQTESKPFSATKFLRLHTDEYANPEALQTATAKYVLHDDKGNVKLEVFLESFVHIADSSYFRSFQKRFDRYDAVLYESILKPKKDGSEEQDQAVGIQMLQQLSTGTLGLAYQYDEVDYANDKMVNADLSPAEITERMNSTGDDSTTILADLIGHIMQKLNSPQPANVQAQANKGEAAGTMTKSPKIAFDLSVFTDPDGIMKIRRLMATALVDSKLLESTLPPPIHNMIIGARNDRAMSILNSESHNGKQRIALFFGVGHMADFEKRLVNEYGMKLESVNWRNAWDLRDGAVEGAPMEGLIESAFQDSIKNRLRQFARGVTEKKQKMAAENERRQAEKEKDKQLELMENTLKALEAKLNALEKAKAAEAKESEESESDPDKKGDG